MTSKPVPDPALRLHVPDRAAWRQWLDLHHAESPGVWLELDKDTGAHRLTYVEAVEEALCFGWIDGRVRGIDEQRYMRLFSPRRARSDWSKLNKQRVEALTSQGLMTAAGEAVIEAAKRNGSWSVLDDVEELNVPDDLALALVADPVANRNFAAFPSSVRKEYLYWITSAKRTETRAGRIREVVVLAAKNRKSRHGP